MTDYFKVISFRKGKEKVFPVSVGSAFDDQKGNTVVILNTIPLPNKEGNVKLLIDRQDAKPVVKPQGKNYVKPDTDEPLEF